jgi:hypothetical protein
LRRTLNEFIEHHHAERNHQGKGNLHPGEQASASRLGLLPRTPRRIAQILRSCRMSILAVPGSKPFGLKELAARGGQSASWSRCGSSVSGWRGGDGRKR